ncbi:uncharacterized protein LOC127282172 [Leptopilina boulardi]|uniref:uncharacterized protein LOC127282172 n=1 Tax=Leptopilina boulardi TaxID=63433 RepID=UPI0021F68164|nr:uncharacterized protein LOC127282172 [Leptopilina boulardi]
MSFLENFIRHRAPRNAVQGNVGNLQGIGIIQQPRELVRPRDEPVNFMRQRPQGNFINHLDNRNVVQGNVGNFQGIGIIQQPRELVRPGDEPANFMRQKPQGNLINHFDNGIIGQLPQFPRPDIQNYERNPGVHANATVREQGQGEGQGQRQGQRRGEDQGQGQEGQRRGSFDSRMDLDSHIFSRHLTDICCKLILQLSMLIYQLLPLVLRVSSEKKHKVLL